MANITVAGDISHFKPGTTVAFTVLFEDDDGTINISSDTVTFIMKEDEDDSDSDAVIKTDGDVSSQGSDGIAIFSIDRNTTASIVPDRYVYDITWAKSDGEELVPKTGAVKVEKRVSDA